MSSRNTRVFFVPLERLADILQGRARITNMPTDAKIIGACQVARNGIGLRVISRKYESVPMGEQIPGITAAISKEPS